MSVGRICVAHLMKCPKYFFSRTGRRTARHILRRKKCPK
uniref:Uncharacterized protein n=1 Tax=Arundo donax TaxID=35708 RepID=A0A0A9BGU7_ARUDO